MFSKNNHYGRHEVWVIAHWVKALNNGIACFMESSYIQTLHPQPGKTNKKILLEKYEFIKEHILKILNRGELTHTELMEALYARVKDDFEGGVQWYGETVKLDLEAREMIERTKSKPEKYRLKTTNR